ncbi:unnamed protein product [Ixodes hexagonus]
MSGTSSFTPDCTPRCKSSQHADLVLSAITKGTVAEIQTYCRQLCHNFWTVSDILGRTALHVAASVGKAELVQWLLDQCHAEVDVRDHESGWTALHRAVFYGQLHCARLLMQHGASLTVTDFDGCTPLDLAVRDRLPYIEYSPSDPSEVYVWGSNKNFSLGLASEQSPKYPEILEAFRRDGVSIQKVEMQKFHSVFLSNAGEVFVCGHGLGGRLGLNSEMTTLNVTKLASLAKMVVGKCVDVASGQDHTVFLMEDGQVLTCGLNTHHQLGLLPPPPQVLSPRAISMKFLKDKKALGVCAARYHTVIYTEDAIYTFGLNAGQLGHPKGDRLQSAPRQISALNYPDVHFTHVVSSDGAIVCATSKGDIYVSQEYKCRKIASKQLEIKQLSIIGGQLDDHCEGVCLSEGEKQDLKVMMLTKSGKVYLWQPSSQALTRCLFNGPCQPTIVDIRLNLRNVALVTKNGEAYLGSLVLKKDVPKKAAESPPAKKTNSAAPATSSLVKFLDRKDCEQINLKRLLYVNRATRVFTSSGGECFAVLQSHPRLGLLYEPSVDRSQFQNDSLQLLESVDSTDAVHDVDVRVKGNSYPLHRYILMSRSEHFQKLEGELKAGAVVNIDNVPPRAFEEVLCFMYTNSCAILESGDGPLVVTLSNKYNSQNRATPAFIKEVQDACKKLGVTSLAGCMSKVSFRKNGVCLASVPVLPKLRFFRNKFQSLYDVTLVSSDNVEFPCHRCILIARLEYFNSMLSLGWVEFSSSRLTLPITSRVLEIILEFLYMDDIPKLKLSKDVEFLCQVLISADQLLMTRLKQMCEALLADLVTLKNVADLLEISYIYNADQLKTLCMHFMCINLPAALEMSSLDSLSEDAIQPLALCYKEMVPAMSRRMITPYMGDPSKDDIERIQQECGDSFDHEEFSGSSSLEVKNKSRRKYTIRRESESSASSSLTSPPKKIQEPSLASAGAEVKSNGCLLTSKPKTLPEAPHPPLQKVLRTEPAQMKLQVVPVIAASPVASPVPSPLASACTFPSLREVQEEKVKSPKDTKHGETMRPMVKLSQKQRKQMTAAKSPDVLVPTPPSPPSNCPWFRNVPQTSASSPQCAPCAVVSAGKTAFPNLGVEGSVAKVPNLSEIVKFEEQKLQNLVKVKPKALHIINTEDKALEELLKFYHAEDNPEERITAVRILPELYAVPVWKKKY